MLFELFISIYSKIHLLSKSIFQCNNSELESNLKLTTRGHIFYKYFKLEANKRKFYELDS